MSESDSFRHRPPCDLKKRVRQAKAGTASARAPQVEVCDGDRCLAEGEYTFASFTLPIIPIPQIFCVGGGRCHLHTMGVVLC